MKWYKVIPFLVNDSSQRLDNDNEVDGRHTAIIEDGIYMENTGNVMLTGNLIYSRQSATVAVGITLTEHIPYTILPIVSRREPPTGHLFSLSF